MAFSIRRGLAALGALSVLGLAVTKIGDTPVVPGYDTGFGLEVSCPAATLCFTTDRGDLRTLVMLRVQGDTARSAWAARLNDGTRLAVRAQPGREGGTVLTISKPDKRSTRAKFDWPSGVTLQLSSPPGSHIRVEDWRVDVGEKEGHDSRNRARWRDTWFLISLVFLGIGVSAAVTEQLSKEAPPRDVHILGRELVATTIDDMKPDGDEDLTAVRGLLREVLLQRRSVDNAVRNWSDGKSPARRLQVLTTARVKFREDWSHVLSTLAEYLDYLEPAE